MIYQKLFNLKPYWFEFMGKFYEERDRIIGSNREKKRPTQKFKVDGQEWVFGASNNIIPPDKVNLFIDEDLEKIYHRKNLALKIFYYDPQPMSVRLYSCRWGKHGNLIDVTKIQNIFAQGGFAPFVYDLVFLKGDGCKYAAQVTEYIESDTLYDVLDASNPLLEKITNFAADNRITMFDVECSKNFMKGKLVDFEFFKFNNSMQRYHDFLLEHMGGLAFGGDTDVPYQSIEEINVKGRRKNIEREKFFSLQDDVKDLPKYFTALDVGCNGAYFLRRCMDYGAAYTVGVDIYAVNEAAARVNNYLGYFNMKFMDTVPEEQFDIVFYLSATGYGIDDAKVLACAKNILYFEGHGGQTEEACRKILEPYFKNIRVMGYVNDYPESGERLVLRCQK